MKILYTWTGYRELKEAQKEHPEFEALFSEYINSLTHIPQNPPKTERGWVRYALKKYKFDKIVLLVDYMDPASSKNGKDFRDAYRKTFDKYKVDVQIVPVVLPDKNDYANVYQQAKHILEKTSNTGEERFFLLGSGTHAMNLCWILLGKTLFEDGAHFLRDSDQELKSFDIPLDLTVEYIPKRLSNQDKTIHRFYDGFDGIIGESPLIGKAQDDAHKAALHDVTVLLIGESGTGKEKFADAIQKASTRKGKPYKSINCATPLLEDTLFGHVKGAYTGANDNKEGILAEVDGGTLFLDEIGECPPEMQAKLLRVLQPPGDKPPTYREYYPMGSREPKHSDVRIIAATNRDLRAMAKEKIGETGSFRSDLLYRLSAIVIPLPPLRKRREDVIPLAEAFLKKTNELFSKDPGYKAKIFSQKTIRIIQEYEWPGNVRELSNAILRGATMSEGDTILPEDLGITIESTSPCGNSSCEVDEDKGIDLNAYIKEEVRKWLQKAMDCTDSKKAAAEWLHLKGPQALDSKLNTVDMKYQPKKER